MKVLVVGSMHFHGAEEVRQTLEAACRELGAVLAQRGHTVIVGSESKNTADRFVVEGAIGISDHTRIIVYRPDDDARPPFAAERDSHRHVRFTYRRSPGDWSAGRVYTLWEADVVILIGGGRGTAQTGYSAPVLQKPVLPISSFGGTSAEIWPEVGRFYRAAGTTEDDLAPLREPWGPSTAEAIVKLAESLYRRNPFKRRAEIMPLLTLALCLALLALWIGLILGFIPLQRSVAVLGLLVIAAFLGSGLRSSVRLVADDALTVTPRDFIRQTTAATLLAFVLYLIYLAGGVVLTGDFVALSTDKDFNRVGVSVSLLGIFAGFLIEEAVEQVRKWLRDRFVGKGA